MITRRAFCGRAAAGVLCWTPWSRAQGGRDVALRVRVVRPAGNPIGSGGLMLGIDEARASARLFGRTMEVELVEAASSGLRDAAQVPLGPCDVLISMLADGAQCAALAGRAGTLATGTVPLLNAACSADELRGAGCAPHLFHVAASEAMQRDAIRLVAGAEDATGGRAVMWHHTLERYGAGQLNARFVARETRGMESDDWAAWMALKIAMESFLRTEGEGPDALRTVLSSDRMRFDGHKGTALSFRKWDRQLRQPLYVIRADTPPESGAAPLESPPRNAAADAAGPNARLDLLGTSASDAPCRTPTP